MEEIYPTMDSFRPYVDTSSEDASVHGEEEAFLEKVGTAKPRRRTWRTCVAKSVLCVFSPAVISCVFSIFTAGILVLVLMTLTKERPIKAILQSTMGVHKSAVGTQYYHCGSTPDEARALGCAFDIMSFAWTPPGMYFLLSVLPSPVG
jgi:hypothetical protein